jgi:hypothetical protein
MFVGAERELGPGREWIGRMIVKIPRRHRYETTAVIAQCWNAFRDADDSRA